MWQDPYDRMAKMAPVGGDGYGLYGDDEGLYLGPGIALVKRQVDAEGVAYFAVRPQEELDVLLHAAYGMEVDLSRRMSILAAVANALQKGEWSRAMISAAHLQLPPLSDDAAVTRLRGVDQLLKYNFNPDEPRDWHGRWTYVPGWASNGQGPEKDKGVQVAVAENVGNVTDAQVDAPPSAPHRYPPLQIDIPGRKDAPDWSVPSAPPAYRAESLGDSWGTIIDTLDNTPGLSQPERHIYADILGGEGGFKSDGTTASGITKKTLTEMLANKRLSGLGIVSNDPKDLTPQQRVQVYQRYFDDVLRTVSRPTRGSQALAEIGDPHSASAFADVMFREGRGTGATMIEKAVNDAIKELPTNARKRLGLKPVTVDGQMGPEPFNAYKTLVANGHGELVRGKLAAQRRAGNHGNELSRINYFR